MTHPETGKAKKFHVVAYSSKHNPQGDANNPLPLPQQLPLLSTIKIAPGIWPEWEHRRDPDYSRRGTSYPPVPAGSAAVPVTATASPEGEQNFDQYRSKTPSREAFTARASPSHLQQQQRYPQSYAPQVMNTGYPNRPIAHPSYPPQDQRYHPYHDPNRNRPFAPPQNGQPPSAPSSVPAIPNPNQPPQEMYFDERRLSQQPPRMSPNMYAPQFDQYGRPYRRDQYFEEFPPPGQYYDPNAQPGQRSPEDKLRDAQYSHERHHSAPTHLAPPTVEMTAPNTGGRKSPKMSIDASLLNPPNGMPPQQQQQTTSAPPSNGTTGGLTLPPLRLAIDERTKQNNGAPPGNSPSGYGKLSPRVVSDNVQNSNEPVKGEDARQLGELGKRVSL